jgi:hypothetical protein
MATYKSKEPKLLLRGKKFHNKIQRDWERHAKGASIEKPITKPSGRKGRVDVFVQSDNLLVATVEVKASSWDAMTPSAVGRNIQRQASQIWDYIESQLEAGRDVSPGIIFPKRPKDPERLLLIEQLFEDRGISVVWSDESSEERKARA